MINQIQRIHSLLITALLLCIVLFTMAFYIPEAHTKEEEPQLICGNVYLEKQQPTDSVYLAGKRVFKRNCTSCHQMHQKVIGPPLVNIFERRDSLWVIDATTNYPALMKRGDKVAIDLYKEYNEISHIVFEEFTDEELHALMIYLKFTQ